MPNPRRLIGIGIAVVVLIGLSSAGYARFKVIKKKSDTTSVAKAPVPARPDSVPLAFGSGAAQQAVGAEVRRGDLIIWVKAQGQTAASAQWPVTAEASGRIMLVPVREGQMVKRGDTLIALDTADFAFALEQATNSLKQAEANYKIASASEGRITDPALKASRDSALRMQAGLVQAELGLRRARAEYAKSVTLAPFDGILSNLKVVPGQRVSGELVTISRINPIRIEAQVLQSEVGKIKEGNQARLTFASYPDSMITGKVVSINPLVDQMRTARVTIEVPNPTGILLPGMTALVQIQSQTYSNRLIVPFKAILQRSGDRDLVMVYIPNKDAPDGKAEWRYVAMGLRNDEYVEIVPGTDGSQKMVEPGEIVLIDGHYTMAHQADIKLVDRLSMIGR